MRRQGTSRGGADRRGTLALALVAIVATSGTAGAQNSLQEIQELRRRLQYDAALRRLQLVLPDLQGDIRAEGLVLFAQLTPDIRDARRVLGDAVRLATRPETRLAAALEMARLEYARGNYRNAQSRLQGHADDPEAALWLGLVGLGLGETARLGEVLVPAAGSDWAALLAGFADLEARPRAAVAAFEPLAANRRSDLAAAALYGKTRALAAMGEVPEAQAAAAELRERYPDTPECQMVSAALGPARRAPAAASQAPGAGERFALQLGAFGDRANALRFRATLPKDLEPVSVEAAQRGSGTVYRVLVGSFGSRDEALEYARRRLAPLGLAYQLVRTGEEGTP